MSSRRVHADLAGQPYPLGATFDGVGHQLLGLLGGRLSASSCACSTTPARKRASICRRRTAFCWHGYLPDVGPGSATASACTARGRPSRGTGAIRPSCCSIPTPRRSTGMWDWNEAVFPYHFDEPETVEERSRQRAVHAQERRHQPVLRLGRRSPAEHALAPDGRLRDARQGLHQAPSRASRRSCAAPMPGWRTRSRSSTCSGSASPRSSCCRCTSSCRTRRCCRRGCATTGATTRSATSRRTTSTRAASAASRCRSSSSW